MAYLDTINNVLDRLREDRVAVNDENEYSRLIGRFVNQAKSDVENDWDWNSLKQSMFITTAAGVQSYEMIGMVVGSRIMKDKNNGNRPCIYNLTTRQNTFQKAPKGFISRLSNVDNVQNAEPVFYDVIGLSAAGYYLFDFWPIPDAIYSIRMDSIVPQSDLVNDTDVILVPNILVELRATYLAKVERGEDAGELTRQAEKIYMDKLNELVGYEMGMDSHDEVWEAE